MVTVIRQAKSMDPSTLKSVAEEHCKGFADITYNSANKDAASLAADYISFVSPESFTVYTFLGTQTYASHVAQQANMAAWLESMDKVGIDIHKGISMKDTRVEVLSSHVALCWMTNVFTAEEGEPFEFVVFYSYRVPVGEKKWYWNFMVSDTQMEAMIERYSEFFKQQGAPIDGQGTRIVS